jgi:hypothetical protein
MPREFMPIMHSSAIQQLPMSLFANCETRAEKNHRQTLETLARRGGLDVHEAMCILLDQSWGTVTLTSEECEAKLLEMVDAARPVNSKSISFESIASLTIGGHPIDLATGAGLKVLSGIEADMQIRNRASSDLTAVNVDQLVGPTLDYQVAWLLKRAFFVAAAGTYGEPNTKWMVIGSTGRPLNFHESWQEFGPLIEKFDVWFSSQGPNQVKAWVSGNMSSVSIGSNRMEAALRAIIRSHEVEVCMIPTNMLSPPPKDIPKKSQTHIPCKHKVASEDGTCNKPGCAELPILPVLRVSHCKHKAQPGGCQLHNLQCGYPKCDEPPHGE